MWDLRNPSGPFAVCRGHTQDVTACKFVSPSSSSSSASAPFLVSVSKDGSIFSWDYNNYSNNANNNNSSGSHANNKNADAVASGSCEIYSPVASMLSTGRLYTSLASVEEYCDCDCDCRAPTPSSLVAAAADAAADGGGGGGDDDAIEASLRRQQQQQQQQHEHKTLRIAKMAVGSFDGSISLVTLTCGGGGGGVLYGRGREWDDQKGSVFKEEYTSSPAFVGEAEQG